MLFASPKSSDEELEKRKEQLRILLSATGEEVEKIVRSNPGVLFRRDVVGACGPKVTLLQERLGISEKEACKLCLQADRLLSHKLETLESKTDWLRVRLTLNQGQLWTVLGSSLSRSAVPTMKSTHLSPEFFACRILESRQLFRTDAFLPLDVVQNSLTNLCGPG